MRMETGFILGMPLERAWPLLTDLERVAPCMPGVTVEAATPDGLRAAMRVKVGPVTAAYRTLVSVESLDEAARTAVLKATGREARGPGTVDATVTATMREDGERTAVTLTTDLALTGKVAQFGTGVIGEVADRLLQQFAARLEADLDGAGAAARDRERAATSGRDGAAATKDVEAADRGAAAVRVEAPPVDLGRLAGRALVPAGARLGIAVGIGVLLGLLLGRRG